MNPTAVDKRMKELLDEEGLDCTNRNTTLEQIVRKILEGGECITLNETNMEGSYD